jgi:hypothetical protein
MPENIEAVEGSVFGGEIELRRHRGVNPAELMLSGRVALEGEAGDMEYWRWLASGSLSQPLPFRLVGAVEGGLGMAADDAPIQRHFYLGGPETFRGSLTGDLTGTALWFGRAEVANDFAAARIVAFADSAWVDEGQRFDTRGFGGSRRLPPRWPASGGPSPRLEGRRQHASPNLLRRPLLAKPIFGSGSLGLGLWDLRVQWARR